ncbi:MAG: hypothetical protein GY940_25925, partial [bacterium]|nr:hypothetical protein [bacterium]
MIGTIHLKQSFKGLRLKLMFLCIAMFLFQMLFAVLGTSVEMQTTMLKRLEDVPDTVRKMMGEGFIEGILKYGILTVGYLHPFTLLVFILFIFMAVSQMVMSEIGSGTIGFTLSKPLSRKRLYINLGIIIYFGTAVIAFSAYLSSYLGLKLFHPMKLTTAPFASIAWNLFLLMIFITGYVVVIASLSGSGKKLFTSGGITLFLFYLLSFGSNLWQPLEFIAPVSPFFYYKPMPILMGSRIGWSTSILLIVVS